MQNDAKKILKIALVSLLFLFIIIYSFFVSKDVLFGVKIKNVNMTANGTAVQDGTKAIDNIIKITGTARNANKLSLNDRVISVDLKGNFDETIALLPGYNIISIKAQDEFGNNDEKNYKLMY